MSTRKKALAWGWATRAERALRQWHLAALADRQRRQGEARVEAALRADESAALAIRAQHAAVVAILGRLPS